MKGCSFGDTKDVRKEWALQNQHYLACAGQKECNLNLTMSQIFDAPCLKEINERLNGNTTLGPAKLFF